VLHEAFDYPFRQVAEVLETSEANARQLASRARAHLDQERGTVVTPGEHDRILGAIMTASRSGDLAALEAVLSEHVQSVSDGGGVVSAARRVVVGRANVAAIILGLSAKYYASVTFVPVEANGMSALLGVVGGAPLVLVTVDVAPDGVRSLFAVLNPHKLQAFHEVAAAVTSGPAAQS
jgi:RNA polymerase sigma-70 factor (ECF subfamily)